MIVTRDGEDAAMKLEDEASGEDTREYPCLLRVTDGKNTKFSTTVTHLLQRDISILTIYI